VLPCRALDGDIGAVLHAALAEPRGEQRACSALAENEVVVNGSHRQKLRKKYKQLSLAEAGVSVLSTYQLSANVRNLDEGVLYEVGVPPFKKGQPLTVCPMQFVAVPDKTYLARMRNKRGEEVLVRRSANRAHRPGDLRGTV
jgi:hypothetical protein